MHVVVKGDGCIGVMARIGLGLVVRDVADPAELAKLSVLLRSGSCVVASSTSAYRAEVVSDVAFLACLTVCRALFAADPSGSLGAVTVFPTVCTCITRVRGLSGLGLWFL